MRRIGTLSSEQDARNFSDYLFTLKIDTQVSQGNGAWDIWLLDEDRLEQGRSELEAFRAAPRDPKYVAAAQAASQQRDAELAAVLTAARQQIDLRERWERPVWLQMPVTFVLGALCLAATLFSQFGKNEGLTALLQIQSITITEVVNDQVQIEVPNQSFYDIRQGEVWRLVTPIFLHMSPMHFIGNIMMLFLLGGMTERERGSWRFLLGVLLIAVISNIAQYVIDGPRFGGASGVVYGLFGYVWLTGYTQPSSGLQISRESTIIMVGWLFLCTTGLVGPVANVAHFAGLGVGLLIAGSELLIRRARA